MAVPRVALPMLGRRVLSPFMPLPALVRWKSTLPGRLGDPNMRLLSEPRMNRPMLEVFKKDLIMGRWGVVGEPLPFPFSPETPMWILHGYNRFVEKHILPKIFVEEKLPMPDTSSIEQYTEVIKGVDGNDIVLYVSKPKSATKVPGILHTHGGGMTFMSANDVMYRTYRAHLAVRGFAVVGVEFRNASGQLGNHPYPAGLNDCMSGLSWAHANRDKLGISTIILSGESGGGNLCSAMALRAKRDGKLNEFDGVFAQCPFIAGPDIWAEKTLTSLQECDGYFIDVGAFKVCAKLYDPDRKHGRDPCAWPLVSQPADLEGLPPHVISVNELDPLRDEGLAYYEKLKAAGVRVDRRIVEGTPHGGDMGAVNVPGAEHIFEDLVGAMKSFSESL